MTPTDEQIINELRELRPEVSERFAAELDAWAAEGFPARKQAPARRTTSALGDRIRAIRTRPMLPALAGAATVLLVLTVTVAGIRGVGSGGDDAGGGTAIQSEEDAETSTNAPGAASGAPERAASGDESAPEPSLRGEPMTVPPTSVPPVRPSDRELKPGQERVQEQSASMTLSTEPDEVAEVADEVVDVVDRYEGIVVSSNVGSADGKGRASFDLRIPTANLQAALADLSDLASVSSRNEGVLDITAPFVSAEERFQDAKAEVDALLEALGEADSATEIASIREQLALARPELAAARAELGALKQRADFSVLSLTVTGAGDGDALDDALSVLEDLAGAGLVALAVIVPLGAIAALGWFGLNALRRRRREKALD